MIRFISREEIIKELGISFKELSEYEEYLEIPRPLNGKHDYHIATLIAKLNELSKSGISLNDIRHLSFCAENFQDLIPALKDFREFSPRRHLKELNDSYHQLLEEAQFREENYRNKILEQENIINELKSSLEDNELLNKELRGLGFHVEKLNLELEEKNALINEMHIKTQELLLELEELRMEMIKQESEIEILRSQINENPTQQIRGAINVNSLLKRKEREIRIQHQKQIFDLKKQVDQIVEQKEKEWNRSQEYSS